MCVLERLTEILSHVAVLSVAYGIPFLLVRITKVPHSQPCIDVAAEMQTYWILTKASSFQTSGRTVSPMDTRQSLS